MTPARPQDPFDWLWTPRQELDAPLELLEPARIRVELDMHAWSEETAATFGVMAKCVRHTFQVIARDATGMVDWFRWADHHARTANTSARPMPVPWMCLCYAQRFSPHPELRDGTSAAAACPWPLPNVWLGVRCSTQAKVDLEVPKLLECPSTLRMLVLEPRAAIETGHWLHLPPCPQRPGERRAGWGHLECDCRPHIERHAAAGKMGKLDWFHVDDPVASCEKAVWIRDIIRQAHDAGVPVWESMLVREYPKAGR
jgi:hypothetical protein